MKVTIDLGTLDLKPMGTAELHALGANVLNELAQRAVTSSPLVTAEMVQLCREGRRIPAIKLYRERHQVGLKEAKQAIDLACPVAPFPNTPSL